MMLEWNEYRRQLAAGVKELGQLSPDTIKGYAELSSAGQKKDLLGAKTRELIALAVAVTARCDGCITVHTEAALKHGAAIRPRESRTRVAKTARLFPLREPRYKHDDDRRATLKRRNPGGGTPGFRRTDDPDRGNP
jgi:AhpD family alkylhydroperoxidase